jgi:hypothetical protein
MKTLLIAAATVSLSGAASYTSGIAAFLPEAFVLAIWGAALLGMARLARTRMSVK